MDGPSLQNDQTGRSSANDALGEYSRYVRILGDMLAQGVQRRISALVTPRVTLGWTSILVASLLATLLGISRMDPHTFERTLPYPHTMDKQDLLSLLHKPLSKDWRRILPIEAEQSSEAYLPSDTDSY